MPRSTTHITRAHTPPHVDVPARSLKRTASTASLPTPPRTVKKLVRQHSRNSVFDADDSDDEWVLPNAFVLGNKKRRTGLDAIADALVDSEEGAPSRVVVEDAFWMGDGRPATGDAARGTILESPPEVLAPAPAEPTRPAPVRVRAPLSPPPSRRRTTTQKRTVVTSVAPVTPPRRSARQPIAPAAPRPVRDSGNNPFLVEDDDTPVPTKTKAKAGLAVPTSPTPTPHVEKPTLTYVYRGVRTIFANPLYQLDPAQHELSLLPPEHPDFEPTELCPPKLLFPQARRVQPPRRVKHTPSPAPAPVTPRRAPHTPSPRRRAPLPKALTLALVAEEEEEEVVATPARSTRKSNDVMLKAMGLARPLRRSPRRPR